MDSQPDITSITALLGEPARANILLALLSGEALPASELARRCRLTPQTVSFHLTKLVAGELLVMTPQGRHRYYQLASGEVAQMLEAIQRIAPRPQAHALQQSEETKALCRARTCYDHLAGKLGVSIAQFFLDQGIVQQEERGFTLTEKGKAWCEQVGLDWRLAEQHRRKFATACLDWSERRDHIGGALGALIAQWCFDNHWLQRGATRSVIVTDLGCNALRDVFGLVVEA